jgi:23S rRNA pseudouridine1911/1915/1917 synthase
MSSLEGERLDRGLALLTGLSRAEASRLVAAGNVRLGGAVVTSGSRRLRLGDLLTVQIPDGPGPLGEDRQPPPAAVEARVVFVDADLVVVDKPAGLVVHPGAGNPSGTLVQQLVSLFPDIASAGPDSLRPGIVHRLDKGTSGLLVVARTPVALEGLARQMAAHATLRRYLAVVYGELPSDEGVIEAPLGRSLRERSKVAVVEGGRPARTLYVVCRRSVTPFPTTFLTCRLETGRTHQVRAHLAAIGHPVLGDDRYASAAQVSLARHLQLPLERPWLHAAELGFVHPVTGEAMKWTSPLPPELSQLLPVLGLGDSACTMRP